jgi:membrane associated rhomboid family serine protease
LLPFEKGFKMSRVSEPFPQQRGESNPVAVDSAPPLEPREVPWVTYTVVAICSAVFAYLNLAQGLSSYDRVTSLLMPSCVAIWSGAYWGLITAAFVHFAFWHILFNMWWAKDFGRVLEPTMGKGWYVLFIIGAAIAGSGSELAFSGQTGIGFSGVVYAMFGYGLVARNVEPRLQQIINKQTVIWMLGWLVLCIFLTVAKVWQIANGAHLGGFVFGCLIASAFTLRKYVAASVFGLTVLLAMVVLTATYAPWLPLWKDRKVFAQYLDAPQRAKAGNPEGQFLYGQILMQEKDKRREGVDWIRKSAEQGYLPAMNGLAWVLATDRDDSFRDGVEAVKWAEKLCKEDGGKSAAYLDTLAAAYAEEGRWEDAASTQRKAVDALVATDESIKTSVMSRLQKYLKQEKVRE